jgi:hypothetical protein
VLQNLVVPAASIKHRHHHLDLLLQMLIVDD